jgi:transposase-like protein
MKNKPLSAYKRKKLIESFCDELTATQAAHRLNLDRNTVNKYFRRIRECIAGYREYQKMKLMIAAMSAPDVQVQAISRTIAPTHGIDEGIPVRIMCIDGQLLTDVPTHTNGNGSRYMMNVSDYFENGLAAGTSPATADTPRSIDCGNLEKLASDFHDFATLRFKKFFGIKHDYAYLYVKEAEFVFNEKEYSRRERLLNQMIEKIFK